MDTSKSYDIPFSEFLQDDSLTKRKNPFGQEVQESDFITSLPEKASYHIKIPLLSPPGQPPKGIPRMWKYFRTFLNLLRRPVVVNDLPIHIQMESTDACNLNCTSCSRDVFVKKAHVLEEERWKKIVDETCPTNLNVSGIGEPFLHPKIFEIIGYAKEKGSSVNCASNFTRIKERYKEVVESGVDQIKVSIDAIDRETFRAIRGEDSFDHIINNIREIISLRNKQGAFTPSIRFNFAIQRLNYKQIPRLVDLADELGVDGIYFQYLEYVDMENRKEMLTADMTRESLMEKLLEAKQIAQEKNIVTNINIWERDFDIFWNKMQPISEFQPNEKPCYFPWFSTWIGADGWIRPCPIMPWTLDEGRMGHIGVQSFSEIWNGQKYQKLRSALRKGERPTRSCKTCIPQSMYNIFYLRTSLLPKK